MPNQSPSSTASRINPPIRRVSSPAVIKVSRVLLQQSVGKQHFLAQYLLLTKHLQSFVSLLSFSLHTDKSGHKPVRHNNTRTKDARSTPSPGGPHRCGGCHPLRVRHRAPGRQGHWEAIQ